MKFGKRVHYGPENILIRRRSDPKDILDILLYLHRVPADDWREKWKRRLENRLGHSAGKLLAGNNTVSILVWCGGGMHCAEYRPAVPELRHGHVDNEIFYNEQLFVVWADVTQRCTCSNAL